MSGGFPFTQIQNNSQQLEDRETCILPCSKSIRKSGQMVFGSPLVSREQRCGSPPHNFEVRCLGQFGLLPLQEIRSNQLGCFPAMKCLDESYPGILHSLSSWKHTFWEDSLSGKLKVETFSDQSTQEVREQERLLFDRL